jgi:hypothetical protein
MNKMYPSLALVICSLLLMSVAAPGQQPVKQTSWQRIDHEKEFSVAVPARYTLLADENYTSNGARVDKRIIINRFVNGAMLIVEVYSGDIRRLEEDQVKAITKGDKPFSVTRDETVGTFTLKNLKLQREKLVETYQFYRSKKTLYVVKAIAATEQDPVAVAFLGSVRLGTGTEIAAPNGSADLNDFAEVLASMDETPFSGTPDREIAILYKPRPHYPRDAMDSAPSGNVVVKVLFSASGKIKDIVPVSGPRALWKASIDAASQIRFLPALKDGKLVSTWKQISYSFQVY